MITDKLWLQIEYLLNISDMDFDVKKRESRGALERIRLSQQVIIILVKEVHRLERELYAEREVKA